MKITKKEFGRNFLKDLLKEHIDHEYYDIYFEYYDNIFNDIENICETEITILVLNFLYVCERKFPFMTDEYYQLYLRKNERYKRII